MFETLIFALVLLMINLLLIYKPIPIFAFPLGLFTLVIYTSVFFGNEDLPQQPYFTVFLCLITVIGLVVNALDYRKSR